MSDESYYPDPRPDFRPLTANENEIAWVRERLEPDGVFEGYVVIEYEGGRHAVCGYYFHSGPYQQFHHMEMGEQELDVWEDAGGGVQIFSDDDEVRDFLRRGYAL